MSEQIPNFIIDELAKFCFCDDPVCDGVLAGGLCDQIIKEIHEEDEQEVAS